MFGDFLNRGKHGQLDFENIDDLEDGTPIVARYNNREFQFGIYGEGYVILSRLLADESRSSCVQFGTKFH